MNAQCKAKTKAGKPCQSRPVKDGLCYLHSNPERASELGRRSGRARRYVSPDQNPVPKFAPPQTAGDVRDLIGQAMADVRQRRLDPKVATTLAYCATVLLRSIEVSDIEARLVALEKGEDRSKSEGEREEIDGKVTTAAP